MARKNTKITEPSAASLVQITDEVVQTGTPSMVLFPARNYCFTVSEDTYTITVPRKGTYHDLDPEYFSKSDGAFDLLNESSGVLYLPSISKVLFATKKYPNIKPNQLFTPVALKFKDDTVDIIGQLITLVNPDELDDADDNTIIKSTVEV